MGVEYPLYTHVHHGYGLNDAFDRSVTLLLDSSQGDRLDQVLRFFLNCLEVLICLISFKRWVASILLFLVSHVHLHSPVMTECLPKIQGAPKSQKLSCSLIRLQNHDGTGVPHQAPSREPPFGAWEEGGPPGTPEQNRNAASEGDSPEAPSLNRHQDPMKSFQMNDEGLGRAPRGLLQADEIARLVYSAKRLCRLLSMLHPSSYGIQSMGIY